MEGDAQVGEYAGGYSDWLLQRARPEAKKTPTGGSSKATRKPARVDRARKLNYREKQDLEALPGQIEVLETEQTTLHALLADPETYRRDGETVAAHQSRLSVLEGELAAAYERWEKLEALR
jgi:ATP-binding cassette subfamily F protein uup